MAWTTNQKTSTSWTLNTTVGQPKTAFTGLKLADNQDLAFGTDADIGVKYNSTSQGLEITPKGSTGYLQVKAYDSNNINATIMGHLTVGSGLFTAYGGSVHQDLGYGNTYGGDATFMAGTAIRFVQSDTLELNPEAGRIVKGGDGNLYLSK